MDNNVLNASQLTMTEQQMDVFLVFGAQKSKLNSIRR